MDFPSALAGPAWFAPVVVAFLTAVAGTFALSLVSGRSGPEHPRIPGFMGGVAILVALIASAGGIGGLMIGFALGWLAIDLTQGAGRSVPPVVALYFVLPPLADGLSVAIRQIRREENPLGRTDHRIHHYLFARGFNSARTLVILVVASALLGAIGYFGWRFGVPEPALFGLAIVGFVAYHAWITEAWRRVRGVYFVIRGCQPASNVRVGLT